MKKLVSILAAAMLATLSVVPMVSAEEAQTAPTEPAAAVEETEAMPEQTEETAAPAEEAAAPAEETVTEETPAALTGSNGRTMVVIAYNGRSLRSARNIIARLRVGQTVNVLAENGKWALVSAETNGVTRVGYVWKSYLADASIAGQKDFQAVTAFRVSVTPTRGRRGFVNLRSAASTASSRVRRLYYGEKLTVTAENDSWYMVTDAYGDVGFVAKNFVKA